MGFLCVALLVGSCKGPASQSPTAAVHPAVKVGRSCPELLSPAGSLAPERVRVFVELAHLLPGQLPVPIGGWLEEHPVAVRSVSNLLVTPTRPVVVPWGACLDDGCDTRSQSWTASLTLAPSATEPFLLSLQLRQGSGAPSELAEGASSPPLLSATLKVSSQTPTVLPGAHAAVGADDLLVTAYLLVEARDLFRLMRCKGEQVGLEELRPHPTAGDRARP